MNTYKIQTNWEMTKTEHIDADSLEEAMDIAYNNRDTDNGEYVLASFQIDEEMTEYLNEEDDYD